LRSPNRLLGLGQGEWTDAGGHGVFDGGIGQCARRRVVDPFACDDDRFFRNGTRDTCDEDRGSQTGYAVMAEEFPAFSKYVGNDLSAPRPE